MSYFDLKVKASFRNLSGNPIAPSAMELLNLCKGADRASMQTGAVRKVVEDWQVDDVGRQLILVNRADKDKTDVALVNYGSGARRTAGKTVEDGIEYSCHLLIVPPAPPRNFPLLLATGGAGMSREQIESMLNALLRRAEADPANAAIFRRPHPSAEHGKTLKLHCTFEVLAHPSLLLAEILAHGTLNEVQLIAHEVKNLDQDFVEKAHSVTIGLVKEGGSVGLAAFRRAIGASGIEPDQLVLRFHDPETGKPASKTIAMNELEAAMTKRNTIKFDTDLMPYYLQISNDIIDKLKAIA